MPPTPKSPCERYTRSTGWTRFRRFFSFRSDRQGTHAWRNMQLRWRSMRLTETLLPLAGVLLGKASLDWLYGLIGGLPQTVPQFWHSRFGRDASLRQRRMIKIVGFVEFCASYRPPGALASWRRISAHAERVGRPPRLVETAPRNHGGASLRPGAAGQDRGADRRQHGGRGLLLLRAARRQHARALCHRRSQPRRCA